MLYLETPQEFQRETYPTVPCVVRPKLQEVNFQRAGVVAAGGEV